MCDTNLLTALWNDNERQLRRDLQLLSQELDCLGLPTININVDVLEQLVASINGLIGLHRKTLTQCRDLALEKSGYRKQRDVDSKVIQSWQKKARSKDDEVRRCEKALHEREAEVVALRAEKCAVERELASLRKLYNSKEQEHRCATTRLKLENQMLNERLGRDIGDYKSQDQVVVELVSKYKAKEQIYEDTITKLRQNNDNLLTEILGLKEEIINALCSRNFADYQKDDEP